MLSRDDVKNIYCDTYKFYLKYTGQPDEPGKWEQALEDFSEIMKQYNACPLVSRMMLGVWTQLEQENHLHEKGGA